MKHRERVLQAKMDRILEAEEQGTYSKKKRNRVVMRFMNNRLSLVGLVVFAIILLMSIGAPLFTHYDPLKISLKEVLQSPSGKHIFGTDKLGRDVFARVLYGGRISILVGFGSALGAAFIGVVLGTLGGYKGGVFDKCVMRLSEVFMSFPQIILVLLLVSMVGQSMGNLIMIFILTGWGGIYRMTRSKMLSIKQEEYVQALKAFDVNPWLICFKHMLPNALGPILVNITLSTAMFILQEASLSFLGLGVPLQIATWGNVLNAANDLQVLKSYWWLWLPVGIVISLFVLSINFIGDGLRDSSDPSQMG
jgi:peptide/nickel transport system permease protein